MTDKQTKKDWSKAVPKKQTKNRKGSEVDSDVFSEEDGYLDSKEVDYMSDTSSSSEGKTHGKHTEASLVVIV